MIIGVLAGSAAGAAADTLSRQNAQKPSQQDCICYRVCEFMSRGVFGQSRAPADPQLGAKCPRLNEEVIYDNMAKCICGNIDSSPKSRTSPNH